MAKPGDAVGSDRGELKRLLKLAFDKPVPMAFALGQDGKAILKLDKIKPPRSLEKGLKEDAAGSRNHRFGTVAIDPEDPTVVRFTVNKEVTGIARKLVVALKGTGFKKVLLTGEDGASLEEHEEEDEGEGAAGPAVTGGAEEEVTARYEPDAAPPAADGGAPRAADAEAPDPAAAAGPAAGEDAAGLTRQLAGLVRKMLGVIAADPTQRAALAQLATDAQLSLKRGQLGEAAAGIEILQMAIADAAGEGTMGLEDGPAAPPPPRPAAVADPAATTRLRKSRVAWTATRAKVDEQLGKLAQAIVLAGEGEDLGGNVEDQFYAAVSPALEELDGALADALDRAADAAGEDRAAALEEVRATIGRYTGFVQASPVIRQLDANPFMQVGLGRTLTATLDTLSRSVA